MLANVSLLSTPFLPLAEATDVARHGHKAANLAVLLGKGFLVPEGFAVPSDAALDATALGEALARLGEGPVAVRSSGRFEDGAGRSYAGAYDTLLEVHGVEAVCEAIAHCRASGTSARALDGGEGRIPVLVQRMVPADAAGVAFSANPVTGERDEVVLSAVHGLGDKLVNGEHPGDSWSVRGATAEPLRTEHGVLRAETAVVVAELARRVEAHFGFPVDIEWALHGGKLWLLQARPITALPIQPEIAVPTGGWQKDTAHFEGPITPFGASTYLPMGNRAINNIFPRWGMLVDQLENRAIGHEIYSHAEPDDGGAKPPPWWVLAAAVRVVPKLRRRLAAAATIEPLIDSLPATWESERKPAYLARVAELAAVELEFLSEERLFAYLDEVIAFAGEGMEMHFDFVFGYVVRLHELCAFCQTHLGWETGATMTLLQGLSPASSAPTRELAEIADFLRFRPGAEIVRAGGAGVFERLERDDPPAYHELRRYLGRWGLRTIGYDPGTPSLAEQPGLVASLLAELLDGSTRPDLDGPRRQRVREAREGLPAELRPTFDTLLAKAEEAYPIREDNVFVTDNLPAGLMRLFALEAGRRLVDSARLTEVEDVMMLSVDEIREGLRGKNMRSLALRRRAELAWVRANPGPLFYGPEPGPLPDLRGLPAPARRINTALLWALGEELTPPKPVSGETLGGLGASPGEYRGRVRVIRSVADIGLLEHGEVLVCRTTTPAWTVIFQRAGALVTDGGSALSHAAIVAREHGIPAVVGTGNATTRLATGDMVTVHGATGRVTIG